MQVFPEIEDVYAKGLIKGRVGERQVAGRRNDHFGASCFDQSSISVDRDLHHQIRRVGANGAAMRRASSQLSKAPAVTASDVEDVVGWLDVQGVNRSLVFGPCFARHDESDDAPEEPRRVARLLGDKVRPTHVALHAFSPAARRRHSSIRNRDWPLQSRW